MSSLSTCFIAPDVAVAIKHLREQNRAHTRNPGNVSFVCDADECAADSERSRALTYLQLCLRSAFKEYIYLKKPGTTNWNSYSQALLDRAPSLGPKATLFFFCPSVLLLYSEQILDIVHWKNLRSLKGWTKLKKIFYLTCNHSLLLLLFGLKCVLRKDIFWSKCSR